MVRLFIISVFITSAFIATGQEITPTVAKKLLDLPGTYVGRLPCADCSGIESSLTLQCDSLCHGGKYMIIDKYLDGKNAGQPNKRKGSWQIAGKGDLMDHSIIVIALDADDTAKVSFYELKKDGDLLPLSKDMHKIDAPKDMTMKRL